MCQTPASSWTSAERAVHSAALCTAAAPSAESQSDTLMMTVTAISCASWQQQYAWTLGDTDLIAWLLANVLPRRRCADKCSRHQSSSLKFRVCNRQQAVVIGRAVDRRIWQRFKAGVIRQMQTELYCRACAGNSEGRWHLAGPPRLAMMDAPPALERQRRARPWDGGAACLHGW